MIHSFERQGAIQKITSSDEKIVQVEGTKSLLFNKLVHIYVNLSQTVFLFTTRRQFLIQGQVEQINFL